MSRLALALAVAVPWSTSSKSRSGAGHPVRNWMRLQSPKVTTSCGEPFKFERVSETTREQQQQAADAIFERIGGLHAELERLPHKGAARAANERRRMVHAAS
jgi:hypothetical protein